MQDWNWFFSSLAQSTAAFVGLLGAFIITKIINNEQKFKENKDKIQTMAIYSKNIKRKLDDRYFGWYNERTREEAMDDIKDDFRKDKRILQKPSVELFRDYNFSPFDNKEEATKEIDAFKEKYKGAMNGLE